MNTINNLLSSTMKLRVSFLLTFVLQVSLVSYAIDKTFETNDWGTFLGSGASIENGVFEFPSDAASWAGFYNSKTSLFPFSFPIGGQISFNAAVPGGGSANVYFKFEKSPYPDTEPSFSTDMITITGATSTQYTLNIPSQFSNTFSSFLFYIVERDTPVELGTVIVTEHGISGENDYYNPTNVSIYNDNFSFGENLSSSDSILWKQEVVYEPYNNEIQDYVKGKVGLDDNDYLVLRIDRTGSNTYRSSRVNSSIYNGIRVGSGEKLSVEFEAQLPMAKDSSGNYVPNVPLWPALWLMGNDKLNNQWVGWPYCAEIDAMEWSPTKSPQGSASGYETQANVAYHWHGADQSSNYNHWYAGYYYDDPQMQSEFHKWRVDIYRYDDGINTNKIEIFMDDVYISGSSLYENSGWYNKEFWYPTTNKHPQQQFGSGDKEYFLIMNIAMGGDYPETSSVPADFDHAEMVVKSVTYEVSSLARHTLDLTYDSAKISVSKIPDQLEYDFNTTVLVEATPNPGYVLGNTDWISNTIIMDEDKSFTISSYPDFGDNDGDGLTNYNEAIIYSSDINSSDSDNDNTSDYFESIAGTSLTDATDYFELIGYINLTGNYNLEYNTKASRNYTISVSDDLTNWHDWKTTSGDGSTVIDLFEPNVQNVSGLDNNSNRFFFKVDIEEDSTSQLPPPSLPSP